MQEGTGTVSLLAAPDQPVYYDPYDYEIDRNVHDVWHRLRDEAPLYWNERHQFFALSRFEDVYNASRDTESLINGHGTVLESLAEPIKPWEEFLLLYMDPPRHTVMRKLVSKAFTPRRVADLETAIRAITVGYLDQFVGADSFDYVAEFAAKLPPMVIGALLGVPESDRDQLRQWFDLVVHRDEGSTTPSEIAIEAGLAMNDYFTRMVANRKLDAGDDLVSGLLVAEIDNDGARRTLNDAELIGFLTMLIGAGTETVARLLSWTAVVLAKHPGQRQLMVDNPALIPGGVEELLRYEDPTPVNCRWVTKPITYYGTEVPAGSKMVLLHGSAGRDEREFPDPDRFDIRRHIPRQASFGYGAHFCLGASLARLEGRIALEETLRRFPTWEIDDAELEWVHTSTVRGFHHVPLHLRG